MIEIGRICGRIYLVVLNPIVVLIILRIGCPIQSIDSYFFKLSVNNRDSISVHIFPFTNLYILLLLPSLFSTLAYPLFSLPISLDRPLVLACGLHFAILLTTSLPHIRFMCPYHLTLFCFLYIYYIFFFSCTSSISWFVGLFYCY